VSQHFIEGLETFLETAAKYKKSEDISDVHYICYPCVDCSNEKKTRDIEEICEHLFARGFMSGYTCWTEHGEHNEVVLEDTDVGGDDDIHQSNHCRTEQNLVGEDIDVGGDDDVDQMNHCCWTEQNMAGEDTDVGGDDDVDDLDEML
jgi:hypothetical protein